MPQVHVVPHTHWDREWYLTFEQFRDKLVVTMDTILELLRSDPEWTHFHLDGQTAMIDDYLAIRPEAEQEIRELVASGRLSCGPWITLVDEYLVSGESIVRNLEDGMRRAGELGGCMMLGYLPDQFGHIGQMPQILRSAGIERAVTWRGVPEAVLTTTFRWEAPDGSTVEVCYLPFGYGQGGRTPADPISFRDRIVSELDRLKPFAANGGARLLTVGDDHEVPLVNLPEMVRATNDEGDLDVRIGSLISFVEAAETGPVTVHGELRSSARANLLPNTYSARIPQKMERGRAETLLERYAEPLTALVPGSRWPSVELAEAWMQLHLNGAHDSVCGCSTDAVAIAVDERTRRAAGIARAVTDEAFTRLCGVLAEPGTARFNPSPFERDGVPPLGWSIEAAAPPTQEALAWAIEDDALVVEGAGVRLRFEDEPDVGDLYNFCPGGDKRSPTALDAKALRAAASFDGISLALELDPHPDEEWIVLDIEIDNELVDHRVRMLVELAEPATTTRAGSAFEIVERPRLGEGGIEEPPSPNWPARAFVVAGGTGYLTEGVIEYELTEDGYLAVTLLRCTGTISRPHAIATRVGPAGPDVATPEAQMIGKTALRLGILRHDPGRGIIQAWERFALPLLEGRSPGGGDLPSKGSLLDIDVPALSSIRNVDGHTEVRIWNPWPDEQEARIDARKVTLPPHRISTVRIS